MVVEHHQEPLVLGFHWMLVLAGVLERAFPEASLSLVLEQLTSCAAAAAAVAAAGYNPGIGAPLWCHPKLALECENPSSWQG